MKKGITPIIAVIILLLIVLALAATTWFFLFGMGGNLTSKIIQLSFGSENANSVIIINAGTAIIKKSDLIVLVEGQEAEILEMSPNTIEPDSSAIIKFITPLYGEKLEVKIIAPDNTINYFTDIHESLFQQVSFGFWVFNDQLYEKNLVDEFVDSGATWGGVTVSWKHIQPEESVEFSWDGFEEFDLDTLINNPENINIIGRIQANADWAVNSGFAPKYWNWWDGHINQEDVIDFELNDEESYETFIISLASRYKDKVGYWRIENEPSYRFSKTDGEWNKNTVEYVKMLNIAYDAIKSVDPNAKVVFTDVISIYATNPDPDPNKGIKAVFELGGGNSIDAVSFHIYGGFEPLNGKYEWINRGIKFTDYIGELKSVLAEYGRNDIPIIITETGYSTLDFMCQEYEERLEKQKEYMIKQHVIAFSNGVQLMMPILFRDRIWWETTPCAESSAWHCMGIMTGDVYNPNEESDLAAQYNNIKKESFDVYKQMTELIDGAIFVEKTLIEEKFELYKFYKDNSYIVVVWYSLDGGEITDLAIDGEFVDAYLINSVTLEMIPSDIAFEENCVLIQDIEITKEQPIYIVLENE